MVVESHPGAATEIGTAARRHAAPDGDTLGIISPSLVVLPYFRRSYDPLEILLQFANWRPFRRFSPSTANRPTIHSPTSSTPRTRVPVALTLGTIGPASATQLVSNAQAGGQGRYHVRSVHRLRAGDSGAVRRSDQCGDHRLYEYLEGELKSGKFRALATTAPQRVSTLPDVPTVAEAGLSTRRSGVLRRRGRCRRKRPAEKIANLTHWFSGALQAPQVKAKFAALGFFSGGQCGADFAAILRKDYEKYGQTTREAHLQLH